MRFRCIANLLAGKYDLRVWPRLVRLLRRRKIDAVITVGAGDKMFWGRLAARRVRRARHPLGPAQHRLARRRRPAQPSAHADHRRVHRRGAVAWPFLDRARALPGGESVRRFPTASIPTASRRSPTSPRYVDELGIGPTDPVVGIVAALRPEKNHELFLEMARRVSQQLPTARFLIIGDGPCRAVARTARPATWA